MYEERAFADQTREWVLHMHQLGVHHFHTYTTHRSVEFDNNAVAWFHPHTVMADQDMDGVEWIHVDTFNVTDRYVPCLYARTILVQVLFYWNFEVFASQWNVTRSSPHVKI